MYEYKCKIRKVVDWDTDIDIDEIRIQLNDERVRINIISRIQKFDDVEKIFNTTAKERVQHLLAAESTLISKVKNDVNEEMSRLMYS